MTLLNVLLSVTVYSAVIYAVILLFRLLFNKRVSPAMMYLVWFLLVARFLIPVTLDSGFSLITIPPAQAFEQTQNTGAVSAADGRGQDLISADETVDNAQKETRDTGTARSAGFIFDLPSALIAVWILGMGIMLIRTSAAAVKLKRRLKKDSLPVPSEWLDIAEKIKGELNLSANTSIVMNDDFSSPALNASIFPVIVMPVSMASQGAEKIEFALRHEMTHLKRKDHLVCLLLAVLRIIYWFNPVIWLASRQIKMDIETACDSAAVRRMGREKTKRYAVTVLDMYAEKNMNFVLGMALGNTRKTAERRVRGIFMRRSSSHGARFTAVLLAVIMLFACFTTACQPVQGELSATASFSNNTPEATVSASPSVAQETESSAPQTTEPSASATASPAESPTPAPSPTLTEEPSQEPLATLPSGYTEKARFNADTDGDGTKEAIVAAASKNGQQIYLFVLYNGGYNKTAVEEGDFKKAYLTRTGGGGLCLLLSIDTGSEDYMTYVFSFSGKKPVSKDKDEGYVSALSGVTLSLSDHVYVLGTWDYTCGFKLKNDYTLNQTSDMVISMDGMKPLHTIRDLPVEMLAGGNYTADTLPADTAVYPVSTDGKSYMRFKLSDGSTGRILFTRGKNVEVYINGIIESEYFDNIEYTD